MSQVSKESVIVTALKSKVRLEGLYEEIEWTVQNRARIETIGSSLYTLILKDLIQKKVPLREAHLSQGFINACFRACCATEPGGTPPKAKYGARPRLFQETKWRTEHADTSMDSAQFQVLVDAAASERATTRDTIFESYRHVESTLQEQQRV